jgi:hypothetical protein
MPFVKKENLMNNRLIVGGSLKDMVISNGSKLISNVLNLLKKNPQIYSTLLTGAKSILPIGIGTALGAHAINKLMDTETGQNVIKKIKNKVGLLPTETKQLLTEPKSAVDINELLGISPPKRQKGGQIRKTLLNTKSKEILKNIKKGNGINII